MTPFSACFSLFHLMSNYLGQLTLFSSSFFVSAYSMRDVIKREALCINLLFFLIREKQKMGKLFASSLRYLFQNKMTHPRMSFSFFYRASGIIRYHPLSFLMPALSFRFLSLSHAFLIFLLSSKNFLSFIFSPTFFLLLFPFSSFSFWVLNSIPKNLD